ncbi:1-deoxy-D-xylulose-5-phosphate reductoisomerase [Candidatus Entotheonella palauensis]|uniref:1-deoxy-D-xylulose 5-phosphate reductoisomerase n=1 Tax=Candidatus Entotheonella gemina TaxID=1429439 RepID=W4LUD8_9BACT|nr:1-deoxy-D-xylulose-5-phosphate reductoisomerase [Candidatus Entotheonella palauensis]ETX01485.1 MAG: 1-deoxy-D-xylulose 5-phosphate reductoisomerase [Candidatus Entotheonella gemina]
MDTRKGLAVLGSTGSIGVNTLDVVASNPEQFSVVTLAAYGNVDVIEQQARSFRPRLVVLYDGEKADILEQRLQGTGIEVESGLEGLCRAATYTDVDLVMSAVVGAIGLRPTLCAVEAGIDVALANKETLVMAGDLVMRRDVEGWGKVIPVDSEHNAIFQALHGHEPADLRRILLTGSGGPFREWTKEGMAEASIDEALKHPNWKMGPKITIDSATMMNKGLEVIEAYQLFGASIDQIQVVVHPQSIIHSMVEFHDGSVLAQLGIPDMRVPISYALTYPDRLPNALPALDLFEVQTLNFYPPDFDRFPCLRLAFEAARLGGTMPAVLNAANEIAVQAFLDGQIGFLDISDVIEWTMTQHGAVPLTDISTAMEADRWAREQAEIAVKGFLSSKIAS